MVKNLLLFNAIYYLINIQQKFMEGFIISLKCLYISEKSPHPCICTHNTFIYHQFLLVYVSYCLPHNFVPLTIYIVTFNLTMRPHLVQKFMYFVQNCLYNVGSPELDCTGVIFLLTSFTLNVLPTLHVRELVDTAGISIALLMCLSLPTQGKVGF